MDPIGFLNSQPAFYLNALKTEIGSGSLLFLRSPAHVRTVVRADSIKSEDLKSCSHFHSPGSLPSTRRISPKSLDPHLIMYKSSMEFPKRLALLAGGLAKRTEQKGSPPFQSPSSFG